MAPCRNTSSWFSSQHAITGLGIRCRRCVLAAVAGGPSWNSSSPKAQQLCAMHNDQTTAQDPQLRQLDDQAHAAAAAAPRQQQEQQWLSQPADPAESEQGLRQQVHSWLKLKLGCEFDASPGDQFGLEAHQAHPYSSLSTTTSSGSSMHAWLCESGWTEAGDLLLVRALELERLLLTLLLCGAVCFVLSDIPWPVQWQWGRSRRRKANQQVAARLARRSAQQAANKAASASGRSSAAAAPAGPMQQQSASLRQRGSANGRMALTWAAGNDTAGGSSDDSSRSAGSRSASARDGLQDDLLAAVRRAVFKQAD